MKGMTDAGEPRRIAFAASFPPHSFDAQSIADRLDELITVYPILSARATADDRWVALESKRVGKDMLTESSEHVGHGSITEILDRLALRAVLRPLDHGGLDIYAGRSLGIEIHRATHDSEKDYLVVCADHSLTDPTGLLRLMDAILADDLPVAIKAEQQHWPLPVEDLIDYTLPEPPAFPPPPLPESWGMVSKGTKVSDTRNVGVSGTLSAAEGERVSAAAKSNGIATLGPVLCAAYLRALWEVAGKPEQQFEIWQLKSDRTELGDKISHIFGNYVIAVPDQIHPGKPADLWELARQLAGSINPVNVTSGRRGIGSLAFAPVPLGKLIGMAAQSPMSFRASVAFSNLTRVAMPKGAEELVWQAGASIVTAPIAVHLLGHAGGVRLNVTLRDGFAITREQALRVNTMWRESLAAL